MNSYNCNSDNLTGTQDDLRIAQATSLAGTWSSRSVTSGSGVFVNNTNYTRTTAAAAPGPIALLPQTVNISAGKRWLANDLLLRAPLLKIQVLLAPAQPISKLSVSR